MGFVKNTKIRLADKDAQRAREEGMPVYVHRFGLPHHNSAASTSISGAAEVIEAIEAAGWLLQHFAVHDDRSHGSIVMLFRPTGGS